MRKVKITIAVLLTVWLSACSIIPQITDLGNYSGSWHRDDDDTSTVLKTDLNDDVILDDNDIEIIKFPKNSKILFRFTDQDMFQMEVVNATQGGLVIRYKIDGDLVNRAKVSDQRIQNAWRSMYRISGVSSELRVAKLNRVGGIDNVLEEVDIIKRNSVKRSYLQWLSADYELTADQQEKAIKIAKSIASDRESRLAFYAISRAKSALAKTQTVSLLRSLNEVQSDSELKNLLSNLLPAIEQEESQEVDNAFFEAATNIQSDSDLRDFMGDMFSVIIDHKSLVSGVKFAGEHIQSNRNLADLLMDLLNKDIRKEALIAVLETATTNISSDSNRADVLVSIIASKNYDKSIASLVEIAANKISSDSEKQRVLSELK
ncbi:MAG: hypothetical protein ACJAVV_000777 [Alphaproteobacteria bacterium]|jgi:hypothetical protein